MLWSFKYVIQGLRVPDGTRPRRFKIELGTVEVRGYSEIQGQEELERLRLLDPFAFEPPTLSIAIKNEDPYGGTAQQRAAVVLNLIKLYFHSPISVLAVFSYRNNMQATMSRPNDSFLQVAGDVALTDAAFRGLVRFFRKVDTGQAMLIAPRTESLDSDLTVGYQFYRRALESSTRFEERTGLAVMALEAILLPAADGGELGFRLSLYASKLLTSLGYEPAKSFKFIRHAYGARSNYVHGQVVNSRLRGAVGFETDRGTGYLNVLLHQTAALLMVRMAHGGSKPEFVADLERLAIGLPISDGLAQGMRFARTHCANESFPLEYPVR